METISIFLPLHKVNEDYKVMLANALTSIETFHNDIHFFIICPINVKKELEIIDFNTPVKINFIENKTGKTDFVNQINLGIDSCTDTWFSILEVDDEYNKIWLTSMTHYLEYHKDVDILLPIVKDINPKGEFVNFTNESVWAFGFSNKQGYLDLDVLLEFQNYQTSGGLYRTEFVKNIGKFKENIKLTFTYEFLLRVLHNGGKISVTPRVGYQHVNFREDSLFWLYKHDENTKINEEDVKFWLETAKKEYFFKNKRDVKYEGS